MIPMSNWKINAVLSPQEKLWRDKTAGMSRSEIRAYATNFRKTKRMSKAQRKRWMHTKQKRAEIIARGSWFEELTKLFNPRNWR